MLDLLPLLFQVNHPLMPGYVVSCNPPGHQYEPDAKVIQTAQRLSARLITAMKKAAGPGWDFFTGGTNSVHGADSDFDVWLCHQGNLEPDARQNWKSKPSVSLNGLPSRAWKSTSL